MTFLPQGKLPPKCPWNVWKLSICTHFQMGYYGYITMDILPFIMDYGYIAHNTPVLKSQVQNVFFTSASAGCRDERFGTWDSPLEVMKLRPQPSRLFKCSPITKNWPAVYLWYIIYYINDNVCIIDISYNINHDIIKYIYICIVKQLYTGPLFFAHVLRGHVKKAASPKPPSQPYTSSIYTKNIRNFI